MRLFPGTSNNLIDFGKVPAGTFVSLRPPRLITDTTILQLPINCVVAGDQKEPVKKAMGLTGAITGPLRGIFDE